MTQQFYSQEKSQKNGKQMLKQKFINKCLYYHKSQHPKKKQMSNNRWVDEQDVSIYSRRNVIQPRKGRIIEKSKRPRVINIMLKKKILGGAPAQPQLASLSFRNQDNVMMRKKRQQIDQLKRLERSEVGPHQHSPLIFNKRAKVNPRKKDSSSISYSKITGFPYTHTLKVCESYGWKMCLCLSLSF